MWLPCGVDGSAADFLSASGPIVNCLSAGVSVCALALRAHLVEPMPSTLSESKHREEPSASTNGIDAGNLAHQLTKGISGLWRQTESGLNVVAGAVLDATKTMTKTAVDATKTAVDATASTLRELDEGFVEGFQQVQQQLSRRNSPTSPRASPVMHNGNSEDGSVRSFPLFPPTPIDAGLAAIPAAAGAASGFLIATPIAARRSPPSFDDWEEEVVEEEKEEEEEGWLSPPSMIKPQAIKPQAGTLYWDACGVGAHVAGRPGSHEGGVGVGAGVICEQAQARTQAGEPQPAGESSSLVAMHGAEDTRMMEARPGGIMIMGFSLLDALLAVLCLRGCFGAGVSGGADGRAQHEWAPPAALQHYNSSGIASSYSDFQRDG